jgi:hypothetical protein
MPEDQQQAMPGSAGNGSAVPPTQYISQFAIAMNANEVLISLGHTRVAVLQQGIGTPPTPTPFQEWLMTAALSPSAAMVLSDNLQKALAAYEAAFGKIPHDPKLKIITKSNV